jgi:hypothetical protein
VVGVAIDAAGWPPQAERINTSKQARLIIRVRIGNRMMITSTNQRHGVGVVSVEVGMSVGKPEPVVGVSVTGVSKGR